MYEIRKVVATSMRFFSPQYFKHFMVALLLVSFAILLHIWPLQAIGKASSWFVFYLAVIVATFYGGVSTGLIATLLASLALIFIWPLFAAHPLINNLFDLFDLLFFVIICSYICYLHYLVKRSQLQLKKEQSAHHTELQCQKIMIKVIDSMPNMIGYWDKELRCQFANNAFSEWFSQSPKDLIGVSFKELTGEKLYNLNEPYIQAVLAGEAQRFERTLKKANGSLSHILAHYIPDFDIDGSVKGFSIQATEVTDLKETEAELKLAACVFDGTLDGVLITDVNGVILSVNPAFSDITGYSADEVIGLTPRILKSYHQNQAFYTSMWERITTQGQWSGEIWNRRKDGDLFLERMTISMVKDEQGRPLRYISVFSDITDLWHKDEHLKHLAFYDALTDLPNRTLLMERLGQKIINCERQQCMLAVMFLDLDGFKLINDTFGHHIGDELLKVISKRLLELVRQSDVVARLGGDEFVFVLHDPKEKDEIVGVAERIISSLSKPVEVCGNLLEIGASIGISMFPDDGVKSIDLLKKADSAMYVSKTSDRNSIHFFKSELNQKD
ncbi:MAG: diguanylate cyclase (GGDEF)-like protein/PAS domain S-box-containing protein [Psychromonas sp.]|jgi:diguanylate cyclase (GGDEF)-like protein/PAS domain S-box-containing protein|uniref:diguanylate cyclase domain-containing protein n=1 Tax=Psychromonas sp. TaxID=1884585 RepID=UPI0039E575EE